MNTTQIVWIIVAAVAAYLFGGLSPAVMLSKRLTGEDIRQKGSGNAGSTNMLRNHGMRLGGLTFLLDTLKGVLPALLALLLLGPVPAYIVSLAVVVGHIFPAFLGFRGGKGVATTFGVLVVLQPVLTLIVFVLAVALIALTGYVSVGSIFGVLMFPIVGFALPVIGWQFGLFGLALAAIILWKHKENIERLINKQENKLDWKKIKK